LKIAVVGTGVSGSYLVNRLSESHEVVGFERRPKDQFFAVCAWGTSKYEMRRLTASTGLDFDKYILFEGKTMHVEIGDEMLDIPLDGLVTFNKHQFEVDLMKGRDVRFGVRANKEQLQKEGFDMIIDATGNHRELLPKIPNDAFIPCYETKMKYKDGPPVDDFYVKPFARDSGYLWYFPLEKGCGYVGAGDFDKKQVDYVDGYNREHPGEVLKRIGRPIRFLSPGYCEPFYEGNVVGVGEAIGTVFPLLGEGIIPSIQCCNILMETMPDFKKYRLKVLKHYEIFDEAYKLVDLKIKGKFSITRNAALMWKIYRYMKKREDRFGMAIRANDLRQIISV